MAALESAVGALVETDPFATGVVEGPPVPEEALQDYKVEATTLGQQGMTALNCGNLREALLLFQKSQALWETVAASWPPSASGDAEHQTLCLARGDAASHLGICHRRGGELLPATQQFQRALKLYQAGGADFRTLAAGHLNVATCQLESKAPSHALNHATAAVELTTKLLASHESFGTNEVPGEAKEEDFVTLAVSFHKLAEAYEALREWGKATFAYTQAYEVTRRSLGPRHAFTRCLEQSPRCPQRSTAAPTLLWDNLKGKMLESRLPEIPPSARGSKGTPGFRLEGYSLSSRDFPKWPPDTATAEEQAWYKMAKSNPCRVQPIPTVPGFEPTLDGVRAVSRFG